LRSAYPLFDIHKILSILRAKTAARQISKTRENLAQNSTEC